MANNELTLSFGLPGLNEIIAAAKIPTRQRRGKRSIPGMAYASMKKKYTQKIEAELVAQGCIPDTPYPAIVIEFEWIEGTHARDPDNARMGAKFVLDAMVNRGVIPNDTRKEVRILWDSYPDGKERAVIIRWSEAEQ